MQRKKFSFILTISLVIGGCATQAPPSQTPATFGYPISGQSTIELATEFKFMPSLSGYYLPAGIYHAEAENADGVFFRAPKGAKSLSLFGGVDADGGIYLPKQGRKRVDGFAYLYLPVVGRTAYYLPNDFFSVYGKKWRILSEPLTLSEPAR